MQEEGQEKNETRQVFNAHLPVTTRSPGRKLWFGLFAAE
jgi:hypothetical protein